MEESPSFICTECGYLAVENFGFCPRCGAKYHSPVSSGTTSVENDGVRPGQDASVDQATQDAYLNYVKTIQQQFLESGRTVTLAMLGIWIVIALSLSITLFCLPANIVSQLGDYTGLGRQLTFEGCVLLASAIFAAVSLFFIYKRKKWSIAFYSCLCSTFVTVLLLFVNDYTGIYFMLCGLLTSLRVRNLKPLFS